MRLDTYSKLPSGLEDYLSYYGWHFSKKLCDFAVSHMKKQGGVKITPYTKEQLESLMKAHNIEIKQAQGYDCVFVANMAKADYLGSSIIDEIRLLKFVKDYIDDPDGYEGLPMTRFYADVIGKGIVIDWEEML
jgi:hypothetical protein